MNKIHTTKGQYINQIKLTKVLGESEMSPAYRVSLRISLTNLIPLFRRKKGGKRGGEGEDVMPKSVM